jgi:hypothetical protein
MSVYTVLPPLGDEGDYATLSPERYDASGGDPDAWCLGVNLTAPGSWLVAAFAGQLSAVPPDEMPPAGIPVKIPRPEDGQLAAFDDHGLLSPISSQIPATTTVYVSPLAVEGVSEFNAWLSSAAFGTEVRWVRYTNVDVESLRETVLTLPRIGALEGLTDDEVLSVFLAGEVAVGVPQGYDFGQVSASVDDGRTSFGIHTDVGYVDPVALLIARNPFSGFCAAAGTNWPFLDETTAKSATLTALVPMPVLHHARIAYGLTDTEWRALGATQKNLYWLRLRAKYLGTTTPFVFALDDMANVFQLEALVEFYLAFPAPAQYQTGDPIPDHAIVPVDLTDAATAWHFVILEPFVDLLESGDPIGPSYAMDPYVGTRGTFGPDRYDAILFLVHQGVVKGWHRWTSYTAHSWLDLDQPRDKSSIVGNRAYTFKSRNASTTATINYAFIVYDRIESGKETCSGKYYYDPATPIPDDPDNKTEVMVHVGYTKTAAHTQGYNGSSGCIVSPSFMRLREQMLGLSAAAVPLRDPLDVLRGVTLTQAMQIFKDDLKVFNENPSGTLIELWNRKFTGQLWIVRPDESTHK